MFIINLFGNFKAFETVWAYLAICRAETKLNFNFFTEAFKVWTVPYAVPYNRTPYRTR